MKINNRRHNSNQFPCFERILGSTGVKLMHEWCNSDYLRTQTGYYTSLVRKTGQVHQKQQSYLHTECKFIVRYQLRSFCCPPKELEIFPVTSPTVSRLPSRKWLLSRVEFRYPSRAANWTNPNPRLMPVSLSKETLQLDSWPNWAK